MEIWLTPFGFDGCDGWLFRGSREGKTPSVAAILLLATYWSRGSLLRLGVDLIRFGHGFIRLGHADDFLHGGAGSEDTAPPILPQGDHAVRGGARLHRGAGFLANDHAAHRLIHDANLVDGGPAAVSRLTAMIATAATAAVKVFWKLRSDFREVVTGTIWNQIMD